MTAPSWRRTTKSFHPYWFIRLIYFYLDFDEVLCPLAGAGASKEKLFQAKQIMLKYSPTGKVPVLIDHELNITICESLAILLHVAELFPDYKLLPVDLPSRSLCLSACAEMHSGFSALRQHFSMNCLMVAKVHGQRVLESNEDLRNDIQRLCELISGLKAAYGAEGASGHLFNHFTVADCMFAPVAIRFNTYCPDYRSDIFDKYPVAVEYFQSLYRNPMVQEWIAEALLEGPSLKIAKYEEFSDDFLQH